MRRLTFVLLLALLVTGITTAQDDDADGLPTFDYDSFYTYHQPTGNRVIAGTGTFPDVTSTDLPLEGLPAWLVGTAAEIGGNVVPLWATFMDDGGFQGTFADETGALSISSLVTEYLPAGQPPVLEISEFGAVVADPVEGSSTRTHGVTDANGNRLFISTAGELVLQAADGTELNRLAVNALPDARIVLDDAGRAAIYIEATDERYVHAIMGDALEAASLLVVNTVDLSTIGRVDLPGEQVFEGLSPIWADVDEDGRADLITTMSEGGAGATLQVYRANGDLLASSDPIGQSLRWRHQLAWGPFGADGENLLAEVLTPHIGGQVGFFRYDGAGRLERVNRLAGYTSHVIESPNLDMAVAGDFNGDGQPELVLPNQDRNEIAGLQMDAAGEIAVIWTLPLDGVLVTNLSAVTLDDESLALAVGVVDGEAAFLRVWVSN